MKIKGVGVSSQYYGQTLGGLKRQVKMEHFRSNERQAKTAYKLYKANGGKLTYKQVLAQAYPSRF
jgi:hypothetical protein